VALLDTSIQVDRKKTPTRGRRVDDILKDFDSTVVTSISLLEFKATLIQECITIHNQLRLRNRFTVVVDALTEKDHRQSKLRGHIFRNIVRVYASSPFRAAEAPEQDERLAEKARLRLEKVIPRLYHWFVHESADDFLEADINCTRAQEVPKKKTVAFGVNLPTCRRNENKFCRIEEFIRENARSLLTPLRAAAGQSTQLQETCDLFEGVLQHPDQELSHSDCRRAGDCLIALEGKGRATHALSTNASEWRPLSELLGYEFLKVEYPEEKTR
jgi:hypothetical protein